MNGESLIYNKINQLDLIDKICYKTNYLKEVIFRIDYSTILKINETLSSDFQEGIRGEFPIFEENKVRKYSTVIEKGIQKEEHLTIIPEWNFYNKDKSTRVGVSSDYLFFQCRKYDTFEKFKFITEKIYNNFQSIYKPLSINRLGLRYVNEISFKEGNPFDWKDYLNVHLIHLIEEYFEDQTEISRSMGQTIINRGDHSLLFTYGIYNKSEFPGKISRKEFILDYDCYTQLTSDLEIIKNIETFHTEIQFMFEKSINNGLRKIMGYKNE